MRRNQLRLGMPVKIISGAEVGKSGIVHEIEDREYPLVKIGCLVVSKHPSELVMGDRWPARKEKDQ